MTELMHVLAEHGARLIDTTALLLDQESGTYLMALGDQPLYYDDHHLTRFAARMMERSFDPLFDGLAENGMPSPGVAGQRGNLPMPGIERSPTH
jgi:hypothetical protein